VGPGRYCACGNRLGDCSIRMVVKPCRCERPGRANVKSTLPSTLKGVVRKTWDDVFSDIDHQERVVGPGLIRERAREREARGDRVVWG